MTKSKLIAIILGGLLILGGIYFFGDRGKEWIGFYYPNKFDLSQYIRSPELNSFEECKEWVETQIPPNASFDEILNSDYECGEKCKFNTEWQVYVCEQTVK